MAVPRLILYPGQALSYQPGCHKARIPINPGRPPALPPERLKVPTIRPDNLKYGRGCDLGLTVFFFLRLITPVIKLKLESIMKKPPGASPVIFIPIILRTQIARTFRACRC